MLMMPETVKINPLLFQVQLPQAQMTNQPTSGMYQRQQRSNNSGGCANRGVRRHIKEQDASLNVAAVATPRSVHRSRIQRLSSLELEDLPLSSSSSSGAPAARSKQSRSTSNSKSEEKDQQPQSAAKTEEVRSQSQMATRRDCRRQRAYSNEWDLLEDEGECFDDKRRQAPERKSIGGVGGLRRGRATKPGPMETLDRRISASSDQLDTLKREKKDRNVWGAPLDAPEGGRHSRAARPHTSASCHIKRPRSASRHNHPEINNNNNNTEKVTEDNKDEVTVEYRGEKITKSRYFFGDILHKSPSSGGFGVNCRTRPKSRLGFRKEEKQRKTAVDIFLEDEGPYSRKLYGPPPAKDASSKKSGASSNSNKRAKSQEILTEVTEDPLTTDTACTLKKGLLWQQRDKLFSRWKERYFVLTKDYFHCFKKATSRITEMGGFIFKIKLIDIDTVELLDKRGYLTICLSLLKEGKIYLRRPEGIRDWYNALQNNIYESKRRKKFWVKRQVTDSANIEQWLLARQKVGIHYPSANCGSSPNLLETSTSPNRVSGGHGNGDVDSGHEGDDQPEVSEDKENKKKGTEEELRVVGPRGINRMSLVSELILKEKLSAEVCPTSKASPELSSGDSLLGETTSSSARSSMQSGSGPASTTLATETSSKLGMGPTSLTLTTKETARTLQHRRLDDSGNDSGHNSMNTNSDTQSDATNSSGEEPGRSSAMTKSLATKSLGRNEGSDKKASTALAHGLNLRIVVDGDPAKVNQVASSTLFQKRGSKVLSPLQSPKSLDSDLPLSSSTESTSDTSPLRFASAFY